MVDFMDRFIGKKIRLILNTGYTKVGLLDSFDDICYNIIFDDGRVEIINRNAVETIKLQRIGGNNE